MATEKGGGGAFSYERKDMPCLHGDPCSGSGPDM